MKTHSHTMKRTLALLSVGALLGIVLCSFFAPGLLRWYAEPVVPGKPFTCEMEVQWAARTFARMQWIVAGVLGVVFAVVGGVLASRGRKRAAEGRPPGEAP